jgi:flagellar basal body-associated protein FliL
MSTWGPIIAVVLALIAAASVAVIAWKMSSDKFYESAEKEDPAEPGPPT